MRRSLQSRRDRQAFTTALVPPPSPMNDRRLAVMVLLLCAVALRLPSELGPGLFVLRTISGSRSLWSSRESTRRMPPRDFLCAAPSPFLLLRFEIGKVELANGKVELANGGRRRTRRWITRFSQFPRTNAAPKMREFERMKEGSGVETAPCGCRRYESTRNDRSPVRKILVRRHVLLQLDGGGVPSHCHFLNTWLPSFL